MEKFEYEVAFSLCNKDIEYAENILNELNPSLKKKVFLYTQNQKELISKIGPEEFRNVFLSKSRVVIILFREEYGNTYYTNLEKESIIERSGHENQGYDFVFLIPMSKGKLPTWYPSTRIYADPFNYSPKEIAKFIEFKVTERDGEVKPVKFLDRLEDFNNYLQARQNKIKKLNSTECLKFAKEEISKIKIKFSECINNFKNVTLPFTLTFSENSPLYFGIGNYVLYLGINDQSMANYTVSVSNFRVKLSIHTLESFKHQNIVSKKESILEKYYRFNTNSQEINGWSEEKIYGENIDDSLKGYLFQCLHNYFYYDLSGFTSSDDLIDTWFSTLINLVRENYEKNFK